MYKKDKDRISSNYNVDSINFKEKSDFDFFSRSLVSRLYLTSQEVYKRSDDKIPLFVPHKMLLKKIEYKQEKKEPLCGFRYQQNIIKQKTDELYLPITTEIPEIRTSSKKSNFVLHKPIRVLVQPKGDNETSIKYTMRINPSITDQLNLIKRLREGPNGEFYYMIYAVDRSSEYFSPYALKIVDYKDVRKTYMTINVTGVTQYSPDEMIFTPIKLWEKEYIYYLKLMEIKVFSTFRLWKSFYIWRKSLSCRKFTEARRYIQENLFLSDLIFGKALIKFKSMCVVFLNFSLVDISVVERLSLFDFVELQFTKLEYVRRKLDEFRELVSDTVYNACIATFLQAGYIVDNTEQTIYGKLDDYGTVKFEIPKDGVVKMNYIERTRKKEKCHRLSCFIHLIDYMQTNMMHGVLLNTYREFIRVLEAHTTFIPENTLLDNNVIDIILEDCRPISHTIQHPYFMVDLFISMTIGIVIDPSQNVFYYVIQTLQTMWEENLSAIKPLLCDPVFQYFIRSIIIRQMEDQPCESSLEILKIIKEDPIILGLKNKLNDILKTNFNAVNRYCQRFNEIKEFYNEDMKFDEDVIRDNKKCDLFRNWCIRYKREIDTIDKVVEQQPLGIFIVQLERFKNAALNAPRNKKRVIEAVMPGICKKKVDALLIEIMETINYLEFDLVSIDDYIAYIMFIDKAQQKVDFMEEQLDYVKELYDMMEEFDIAIPTKDISNYEGIIMQFTILRLAIEKRLEKKQKLITMFDTEIQKDMRN